MAKCVWTNDKSEAPPDLSIDWIEEPYPMDVTELLVTSGNNNDVADFPIDDSNSNESDTDA